MTDIAASPSATITAPHLPRAAPSRRVVLAVAVVLAIAAALLVTSSTSVNAGIDSELAMLLRFMAATKAAMALGAVLLIGWRLAFAASIAMTLSYVASAAAMAAAPVLIWQLAHVATGAVLFHIGMLGFLSAAWIDRGDVSMIARTSLGHLRATRSF